MHSNECSYRIRASAQPKNEGLALAAPLRPRHHVDMLEYQAEQQETTVGGVLARELDGIASAHFDELSAALPGFAEAMAWPG